MRQTLPVVIVANAVFVIPYSAGLNAVYYAGILDEMTFARVNMIAASIFAPPILGAMLWAGRQTLNGKPAQPGPAIAFGLRAWARLFVARLAAGVLIGLAMLLLVVPGLVLAVRWALLNPVVLFDDDGASNPRARSAELVKGYGWQWFTIGVMYFGFVVLLGYGVIYLQLLVPAANNIAASTVLDVLLSILGSWLAYVQLVYYWELTGGRDEMAPQTFE